MHTADVARSHLSPATFLTERVATGGDRLTDLFCHTNRTHRVRRSLEATEGDHTLERREPLILLHKLLIVLFNTDFAEDTVEVDPCWLRHDLECRRRLHEHEVVHASHNRLETFQFLFEATLGRGESLSRIRIETDGLP